MVETTVTTPDALRAGREFEFTTHQEILQMMPVDTQTQQETFTKWLTAANKSTLEFVKPGEKWTDAAPVFQSMKRGTVHLPDSEKPGTSKAYEATTFDVTAFFENVKLQAKMMGKPKVEVGKELLDQVAVTLTESISTEKDTFKDDAIFVFTRKGLGQRLGKQIDKLIGNKSIVSAEEAGNLLDRTVNKLTLRGLSDAFQSIMNPKKMDKEGEKIRRRFIIYSGFFLNDSFVAAVFRHPTLELLSGQIKPDGFWQKLNSYGAPVAFFSMMALATLNSVLATDLLRLNQVEATHSVGEKWEITLLKPKKE